MKTVLNNSDRTCTAPEGPSQSPVFGPKCTLAVESRKNVIQSMHAAGIQVQAAAWMRSDDAKLRYRLVVSLCYWRDEKSAQKAARALEISKLEYLRPEVEFVSPATFREREFKDSNPEASE